jgi:transcriptional regulator with XRE-family HTH domain
MLMDTVSTSFGAELRRRRLEAGYSLTGLSRLVHYSRGHLSKVETGAKAASADLARRCDAVLGGDGVLIRLAARQRTAVSRSAASDAGEVWVLELDSDGKRRLLMTTRRELLATGVLGDGASAVGRWSTAEMPASRERDHISATGIVLAAETFREWFRQIRGIGQLTGPDVLMPILVAHIEALHHLAERSWGDSRNQTLVLAAQYAEYAGWMAQERGSDADAAWWTDRAVVYAEAGGDHQMSAYALVRRGLIAMYQRDAARTVALAQAAQHADCRPRIRGLAAQREAQGHALAGDRAACLAALDRAGKLLEADPVTDDEFVIGSSHVADIVKGATGWSLVELGRPQEAAQTLRDVWCAIPRRAMRARARYGARLALALASCRQLDEACAVTSDVLDSCTQVQSATICTDLRALSRSLRRWHAEPAVRRVSPRLAAALQFHRARPSYLAR